MLAAVRGWEQSHGLHDEPGDLPGDLLGVLRVGRPGLPDVVLPAPASDH